MSQIKGLLTEEMPREKLIKYGPETLTEVELLAINLRTGTKDKNVIELSREIIQNFGTNIITRKTYEELLQFKGISKAKACQIVAIFELSRRFQNKGIENQIKITNSKDIFELVKSDFENLPTEKIQIILINSKNNIIKKEFLSIGNLNYSELDIRKLIKRIFELEASGFFLVHNHPSQDTTPSSEDIQITNQIKEITKKLNIRFLDHLIISNNKFYSFFDNNKL